MKGSLRTGSRRRNRGAVLGCLLSVGLLAAGCGDDDDGSAATSAPTVAPGTTAPSGSTSTTGSPASTTTEPLVPIKIRFVTGSVSLNNLSHFAALADDAFEANGVDLQVLPALSNSALMVQTVLTGDADFALIGSAGMLPAIAQGQDIVAVADVLGTPPLVLSVTADTQAKLAAKGITATSPIADRAQALKGLSIGTLATGSTTDIVVRTTLATYDVNPESDVTIRPFTEPAGILAAAKAGQVDAFLSSSPSPDYPGWIDYGAGDVPAFAQMPYTTIVTTRAYLKGNPEAVRRFLRAEWSGRQALESDPTGSLASIKAGYYAEMAPATYEFITTKVLKAMKRDLVPTAPGFEALLNVFNASQSQPVKLTFDQVYDLALVNETRP